MEPRKGDVKVLWNRYFRTRSEEDRNLLVEHYTHVVHAQAARLSRRLPAQVSYDEICSAGYDGLIEAVAAYDPARKAKFETFCQQRIIGAVMDWLRSLDPQSRTIRTFEKRRMAAQEQLEAVLNRRPTHDEIARRMGVSQARYDQLARISQLGREIHFSVMDSRSGADAQGRSKDRTWDVCDHRQEDPSEPLNRATLAELITRGLARDERLVLMLYYYEDLTMAEIGAVLKLSESRVSQIHKEVLQRLRRRHHERLSEEQLVA